MASDNSMSDAPDIASAGNVDEDATATTSAETTLSQQEENKTEGTKKIQTDDQKSKPAALVVRGEVSKEGTEPVANTTTASTSAVSKPQDGTLKSPTASRKPHVLSPLLRFPLRVGITWKKGERLEAMDFSKTWYPSKIVEIDENEKSVLIHFDGWNSRYDEWVPMNSDKLRPQTRHSERKDKKSKNFPQPCAIQDIYHQGEGVLARWTDCKKYPAKISRLMPDGTFEVFFYDGVTRNVQPINIQPLPEEMKDAAENIQIPASSLSAKSQTTVKSSFKNVELELPEYLDKRKKCDSNVGSVKKQLTGVEKRNRHMEKSIKKSLAHISGSFKKSPLKAHRFKAMKGTSKKTFKTIGSPPSSSSSISQTSSSSCSSPSLSTSSSSSSVASSSIPDTHPTMPGASVVSSTTAGNLKMVLKIDHSPSATTSSTEQPTVLLDVIQDPLKTSTLPTGTKRVKKRCNTDPTHSPRKKRKKKLKEAGLVPKSNKATSRKRGYSLDSGAISAGSPHAPIVPLSAAITGGPLTTAGAVPHPQYFVPSKAFVVEEDHNPFKCPFDGCTKEFRKENLLTSHIKHYHDNLVVTSTSGASGLSSSVSNSAVGTGSTITSTSPLVTSGPAQSLASPLPSSSSLPAQFSPTAVVSPHTPVLSPVSLQNTLQQQPVVPARRRRRKTDSFCSTDSDVSVSSKGRSSSSKRQRHDSEISVTGSPDILSKDLWADVKLKAPQDSLVEDSGETEEEDVETDLVNCICQLRETNGLMIQCDVCMCWQHFTCVDSEGTGRPPANYVCLACERPKGVRDSCKYMYDMGWERRGELPTFPFLGETFGKNTERLKRVSSECIPLSSALMSIKAVLHSTRRQIKISKEEDEPEFQLWQTDWDNWTKPEEDLTLTPPRSVEAAPSPAPSTFMFPLAPNSPPQPSGIMHPETCPGLENLPPPPSSETSISMSPSSYQDSFKSWLSTAKAAPKKSSSSHTSSTSSSHPKSESNRTQFTTSTHFNSDSKTNNSSTELCDNLTTAAAVAATSVLTSSTILPQQKEQQSNSVAPSTIASGKSLGQQQQQPMSELSLPPISLDTQSEQSHQQRQMLSPQLTPPMNSNQRQVNATTLSQTPSSVRSCSRISSLSSSLVTTATDGSGVRNDLSLIRGDLFALGPGGDSSNSPSEQTPRNESHTHPPGGEIGSENQHDTDTNSVRQMSRLPIISPAPRSSSSVTVSSSIESTTSSMNAHTTNTVNGNLDNSEHEQQLHHNTAPLPPSHNHNQNCHPERRIGNGENGAEEETGNKEYSGNASDAEDSTDVGGDQLSGERRRRKSSSFTEHFVQGQGHPYHQPLRELYIDVNGISGGGGDGDTDTMNNDDADDDNDTDTAEESVEPYRDCERNLLVHISRTHDKIENQLEDLEKQIEDLEAMVDPPIDSNVQPSGENVLNDMPALKKSLTKLAHSLGKIQNLSMYR